MFFSLERYDIKEIPAAKKSERGVIMQTPKEAILAAYRHQQPEYLTSEVDAIRTFLMPGDRYFGSEVEGYDLFGVRWTQLGPDPGLDGNTPTPGYRRLADITRWREDLVFPDLDSLPLEIIFSNMTQGFDREQHAVRGMLLSGNFERLNQLIGMEDALCVFYEEPEAADDFFSAMADYKIRCIDKLIDYQNPDIILMHDDWGMNANLFFSPEIWRKFIKPHERRFADHIHARGKLYEHHSCGYITPLIPDLVEIGLDAIGPLNICNDLTAIKRDFGRQITLLGGVDNQRIDTPDTSEEMIRAEARRVIDVLAPGGSYLPTAIFTKQRTVDIFYDEVGRYGRHFYN
jgi:hypothetical protein